MVKPALSASRSASREKPSWRLMAAAWPNAATPIARLPPPPARAASSAPARLASMTMLFWLCCVMPRAIWRCTTWPISCASTAASSDSLPEETISPVFTPMKPPGMAKALISGSRTPNISTSGTAPGENAASLRPMVVRYWLSSGSST